MKYILILFLMLGACAKNGSNLNTAEPISCGIKPLFSEWTEMSKTDSFTLDLRGFKFGKNEMLIRSGDIELCKLDFTIEGSECNGTYQITNINMYFILHPSF